jgi:hypothetical protein
MQKSMGIPDFPKTLLLFNHLGNWKKMEFFFTRNSINDNFVGGIMCHFSFTKEKKTKKQKKILLEEYV